MLQTACQQERTEAFQSETRKVVAYMNNRHIKKIDCDVAQTLLARNKGFGTGFTTMNGVIEWT